MPALNLVTCGLIVGSIASSTSLIIVNKMIMDEFGFNQITFLTSYHFLMTFSLLELMCRFNFFPRAIKIPSLKKWFLAAVTVGGVVFMNLNLMLNSVGFYQLSKLCAIPCIVAYNYLFEGKETPLNVNISLLILLVGIGLFTINDIQFNVIGCIVAIIAVCFVAVSQTQTGTLQHEFDVSGPALQHATALQQFEIAIVCAFLLETSGSRSIFEHHFKLPKEINLIILTGFIAVSVNVCAFGLIGKTSAVTYQVAGHCKTILIFIFGLIMFPDSRETKSMFYKKISGLVISMSGMFYYTYLKLQARPADNSAPKKNDEDMEKLIRDSPNEFSSSDEEDQQNV